MHISIEKRGYNPLGENKPREVNLEEKAATIEKIQEMISMADVKKLESFLEEKNYSFSSSLKNIRISFVTKATVRGIFSDLLGEKYEENNLVDGDGEVIYYFGKKNIPQTENENVA